MIDGLARAAASGNGALSRQQPRVQRGQRWHGLALTQRQALWWIESGALLLDRVQRRDAAQRLLGDGAAADGVHVEEIASDMGQAGQFGRAVGEQGLATGVVVHHQVAAPAMQEGARVGAGAADLVVEDDDRWAIVMDVGSISPQVGVACLATARVKLAHRRFIGMQAVMLPQQFGQPVGQRLQRHEDAPDPPGQRRARQRHALARGDLLDPVQRQMVEILAGGDPCQQAGGGQAAINDGRRDQRGRHRLAWTARILRTNMAMHEEARRLHVELLADVLANLDQVGAALAALARLGLVAVFDARQFRRQRLAAGPLALSLGRRLAFELFLDGGQVGIDRFLEQQPLLADERFAGLAETYSPILGQLVRERGDLEILLGQLGLLLREQRLHLRQQGRIDIGTG